MEDQLTTKLYSVSDLAALAETSPAQINVWRGRWNGFPLPSYSNQKDLMHLWLEDDKDTVLELVGKYRSAKQL